MSAAKASLLPRPRTRPLYFLPPPPPSLSFSSSLLYVYIRTFIRTYMYSRIYMHTCDGPLWALLTLRCRYLVACTRARGFSIILKQPSRSILIPPGALDCIPCIHRYRTRCTTRQVIIVVPRHYARRDERIPIEKSTTGNEEGSFLPRSLVLLLDCFHRCIFCEIYATSVETPEGRALRERRKRIARDIIARSHKSFHRQ